MTLPILLVVGALIAVILEVFLVSLGMLAVVAAVLAVSGIVMAFGESAAFGWTMASITIVGAPVAVWWAFRMLPRIPWGRAFYLPPPQMTEAQRLAGTGTPHDLAVGAEGETASALRPSGIAMFGDNRLDVLSGGEHIPSGTRVRVTEVSGNRIVVEATE